MNAPSGYNSCTKNQQRNRNSFKIKSSIKWFLMRWMLKGHDLYIFRMKWKMLEANSTIIFLLERFLDIPDTYTHTHTQSRPQRLSLGLRWAKQNDSLFKKKPITHLKENIFIFLGAIFFLRPWEEKEHVAAWKKRERWDERITRVTFFLKESYEKICPQSIFFKFFNVTFFLNS